MITLRRETDYAIHLLKELAKVKHGFLSLRDVADNTGISFLFLQKIARKLRAARLIKAGQGVSGGYCLNIPASKITLKAIIEATEKDSAILPCLCAKNNVCPSNKMKQCLLKNNLGKMNKKIEVIFKNMTLNKI
jgi:Rrf2 family protein